MTRKNTIEDFWNKVRVTNDPEDCWEFTGFVHPKGYGHYYHDNTYSKAHRYSYELVFGPLHSHALHGCDNPRCCNPNHIYDGNALENAHDRDTSGRANTPKGERQGKSKLTERDVKTIKQLWSEGVSQSELGRKFDVTQGCVWRVVKGINWKHVC